MAPTFYREDDPSRDTLPETFIDRYTAWGITATDAPKQYHQVNAVVMLSTIMSPYLVLQTSYGDIKPNIWSMILAGTTVTRKSTTMDMAIRMLHEVHPDFLMGTDGSPEGIMSELSERDGKISMFHRDEITGWIDQTLKRDYMAGMLETFTRLYDGKSEKRVLRSGSVEVNDPNLVIMSGGIKTKMQEIINMDHIRSGFLPRFIIVSGTTRAEDVRPIGPPPSDEAVPQRDPREAVLEELYAIASHYLPKKATEEKIEIAGVVKLLTSKPEKLKLTASPEAWKRIQQLKYDAQKLGDDSSNPDIYVPLFDRLSNTVIKLAMLLCGAERRTEITTIDVCKAIHFSDRWVATITDFAEALERMPDMDRWERKVEKILKYMDQIGPKPLSRSEMMQKFRVKSREVEDIERTLIARGKIRIEKIKTSPKPNARAATHYVLNHVSVPIAENSYVQAASAKTERSPYSGAKKFLNVKQSEKEWWAENVGTETPAQQMLRMPLGEDG